MAQVGWKPRTSANTNIPKPQKEQNSAPAFVVTISVSQKKGDDRKERNRREKFREWRRAGSLQASVAT